MEPQKKLEMELITLDSAIIGAQELLKEPFDFGAELNRKEGVLEMNVSSKMSRRIILCTLLSFKNRDILRGGASLALVF